MIKPAAAPAGLLAFDLLPADGGITAYLSNGGTARAHTQQIAGHSALKTTKFYDQTADTVTVDGDRGRGQARPFGAADLAAVLATCHQPRRRGRSVESEERSLPATAAKVVEPGLPSIPASSVACGGSERASISPATGLDWGQP